MVASALARCTGLRSAVSSTAEPSRRRSVTAAAHASVDTASRIGAEPRTCSTTQALSKPSASACLRKSRIRRVSTGAPTNVWGIATPSVTRLFTRASCQDGPGTANYPPVASRLLLHEGMLFAGLTAAAFLLAQAASPSAVWPPPPVTVPSIGSPGAPAQPQTVPSIGSRPGEAVQPGSTPSIGSPGAPAQPQTVPSIGSRPGEAAQPGSTPSIGSAGSPPSPPSVPSYGAATE